MTTLTQHNSFPISFCLRFAHQVNETDFTLTFMHAPGENVDTKFYYAFTFPFTYTDGQNMLDKFDRLFQKQPAEMAEYIRTLSEPVQSVDVKAAAIASSSDAPAICDCDKANDIYYHRELLIKSVEQRRVDLLTISSFHGIQEEREARVSNLFSDATERCHTFKDKKVSQRACGRIINNLTNIFVYFK